MTIYRQHEIHTKQKLRSVSFVNALMIYITRQPRPQGHLCGCGEELDDPGKGCKNLQDSWRFSSMRCQ